MACDVCNRCLDMDQYAAANNSDGRPYCWISQGQCYPQVRRHGSTKLHINGVSALTIYICQIQWRALDEINAGVCDGMTYEEIKKNMPEEYEYVANF